MIKNPQVSAFRALPGFLVTALLLAMTLNACNTKPAEPSPIESTVEATEPISLPSPTLTLATPHVQDLTATLPAPTEISPLSGIDAPSQTVNGYTATIESYYIDSFHLIFHVRISGGKMSFGSSNFLHTESVSNLKLYDANGYLMNTSTGGGPASDPDIKEFEFMPPSGSPFPGDHLQGHFVFAIVDSPRSDHILAQFRFDFSLPIYNVLIFNPKQTVAANGLQILLDRVTITPSFTQVYLCFPSPSYAPWQMGSDSVLQLDGREAVWHSGFLLFDPAPIIGDRTIGTEPDWVIPTKEDRCLKYRFAIGSANPSFLTLTIPDLENPLPQLDNVDLPSQLIQDYPGMSPRQALHHYLEDSGNTYKGPWEFRISLKP